MSSTPGSGAPGMTGDPTISEGCAIISQGCATAFARASSSTDIYARHRGSGEQLRGSVSPPGAHIEEVGDCLITGLDTPGVRGDVAFLRATGMSHSLPT